MLRGLLAVLNCCTSHTFRADADLHKLKADWARIYMAQRAVHMPVLLSSWAQKQVSKNVSLPAAAERMHHCYHGKLWGSLLPLTS